MLTPESLKTDLLQFCGTCNWYGHFTRRLIYTDGVKFLAEAAKAYWLIDAIAAYQGEDALTKDPMLREFQVWELKVAKDRSAVLTCVADTGKPPAVRQVIEFTDFPLPEVKLYVGPGEAGVVLMLPGEY